MIPLAEPVLGVAERRALARCVASGFVSSSGPMVGEFERHFAEAVGTRYAVATSSGTAALHVSLAALGIERGDRVAAPDLTFVATVNPVLYCGATPVLIDVTPDDWCLDPEALRQACRRTTGLKAVIPVHLYGNACDMDAIRAVAREFGLFVVEDATEALGTRLRGRQVGTLGDVGCFSVNGNKLITTGAGGMVVTNSHSLADRVRHLVNQARVDPLHYRHDEAGFNYRMSSVAAAMGLAQLSRLESLIAGRRRMARRYADAFGELPGITVQPEPGNVRSCFWLYSILVDRPDRQTTLLDEMRRAAITPRPFFTPLHRQPYLNTPVWRAVGMARCGTATVSAQLAARGLNLPSSYSLTARQQDRVVTVIRNFMTRR